MRDRARLTITDVVYLALALAALAALVPPFLDLLGSAPAALSDGTALLMGTVVPVAAVVLLSLIVAEARSG